jgi:hypothetical protein
VHLTISPECLFVHLVFFRDRVSLCSPGTHSVDQAGLELRNLPASASRVLGLKACATLPGFHIQFLTHETLVRLEAGVGVGGGGEAAAPGSSW